MAQIKSDLFSSKQEKTKNWNFQKMWTLRWTISRISCSLVFIIFVLSTI